MTDFIQLLVAALAIGSVYALLALGYVLIYTSLDAVNFAQGDFAMVAAFVMATMLAQAHLPYWLAIIIAVIIMGIVGYLFQLGVYVPFQNRQKSVLPVMISTLGAGILMQNVVLGIYGPYPQLVQPLFSKETVNVSGVILNTQYLVILAVTIVLFTFQYFLFEKTMLGKKMRAVAQDKDMSKMLGISISFIIAVTFIYSAILAGIAGILIAPIYMATTTMGIIIALKAFAASIIGGFSSVQGAIIGGISIGVIETFAATYISGAYKDAFAFLILILFLFIRPQGIFGEKIAQKA